MFLFGKSKRQDENALRSGTVERVPSRMMAVPRSADLIANPDEVIGRLHDTDEIKILSGTDLPIRVAYKGEEYTAEIGDIDFFADEHDPALQKLSPVEREITLAAKKALGLEMMFADNNMDSYHLQVKLLDMLVPDMAALIDDNSYRAHSGRWAVMTAASKVAPSPEYMFVIHCVSDDDSDSVWIHTHGLTRCGTIELEILGADINTYNGLGNALNQMAQRLVGDNKFIDEKEPLYIGVCGEDKEINVTWQRSEWSFKDFPKNILGGPQDRNEEHSINMGVIYLYADEKDILNGKLTPILKWQKELADNAIYFKTTAETQRMRALAQERVPELKKLCRVPCEDERTVLLKIGLKPDEGLGFDDDQLEYIWFEAGEMGEESFTATLTQNAYYVEGMVEGVQKEFTFDDIVDWRVYLEGECYTPDTVYRFCEE